MHEMALVQFAGNADPDQGFRCPLKSSVGIVVYVDKQNCSDQTVCMRMLIWTFSVRICHKGHMLRII